MRSLIIAALVAGLAALAHGCQPPSSPTNKDATASSQAKTLTIGDPAPKLKVDRWLHGGEVKQFLPGTAYVVEFWATWCGPCLAMMPHMGQLQREYSDKRVTFIGFSARDQRGNDLEAVSNFVSKRGPKLGYTFAYGDDRATYDAWMTAAGQGGIPCCFVVDRGSKIAYIGHPMYLDLVLPKVVASTWTSQDVKMLLGAQAQVNGVFEALKSPDPEVGLTALAALDAKYPELSRVPYFVVPRVALLLIAKRYEEAGKAADKVMAMALEQDNNDTLQSLSGALRSAPLKQEKELADVAVRVAEAGLKVAGDKDVGALMTIAETYFAAGNSAKAREYGAQAIAAARTQQQKQKLENHVKLYDN